MTELRPEGAPSSTPLLTIGIPTFNRAGYLQRNVCQLAAELRGVAAGQVEIVISDNCSPDDTRAVAEKARDDGLPIRYVRNDENIGWGRNFNQCFELARGKYVLLLGDDDLIVDGGLRVILDALAADDYGVVCIRPYGFDVDYRSEFPGRGGGSRVFLDASEFLLSIGALMTLTSACVINKSSLHDLETVRYSSGDLGSLHLVLRASLGAGKNLFIEQYLLAGQRQNSFNYDYAKVFVEEYWRIIDDHVAHGLRPEVVRRLERRFLLSYYPFYMYDLRHARRADPAATEAHFSARFHGQPLYEFWLAPTLKWPRPLALIWGALTTLVGRCLGGEFQRGVKFAINRLKRSRQRGQPDAAVLSASPNGVN